MPASRSRNDSVPSTSSSGSPAAKPRNSMRRLSGARYTRTVSLNERRGGRPGGVAAASAMDCGLG